MESHATLIRLADICKSKGITAMFTSLSAANEQMTEGERSVSSLMDTWISLSDIEANGERNRVLYLLKSRGMNHSKQLREYRLTNHGVDMVDAYVGPDGVLTGTARVAQEAREREASIVRQQAINRRRRELARKRAAIERDVAERISALEAEESEVAMMLEEDEARERTFTDERERMAQLRGNSA